MSVENPVITVVPGSEIDHLVESVGDEPVVLERNGSRFLLMRLHAASDQDPFAGYDPDAALAGMQAAAGCWRGLQDADAFKTYIRKRRRTANRPPVQL